MVAKIINGKEIAEKIKSRLKEKIREFREKYNIIPTLSVIMVGEDSASKIYVRAKAKACKEIGIELKIYEFSEINENELIELIQKLNKDKCINGILVQLPLPKNLNEKRILQTISSIKDVDGFHSFNLGNILIGNETLVPATPLAILKILEEIKVRLEGKDVVIINHSIVIGKPLAILMLNREATVTVCHVKTKNLSQYTKQADILITATGVPKLIKKDMVKAGVIVIDAGIKQIEGKLCGDVDFEQVKEKASAITPVPGGVGPLTVAMVLKNTLTAAELQQKLDTGSET